MIVTLKNGEELDFPDGTSPDKIKKYVYKNYGHLYQEKQETSQQNNQNPQENNKNQTQQSSQNQQSPMQKFYETLGQGSPKQNIYRYGVADPLSGISEIGQNIRKGLNNLNPFLFPDKPKDVDYSKTFGIPQQENTGDVIAKSIPDVAASLSVPEFKLGEAATSALSNAPKIGSYLKAILESKPTSQAISQGLYSAATAPENKTQAGLTSGAITAPTSALSEAILSRNPALSKIGRLGLGTALGSALGYGGYKAGESLGFSPAASAAAGSALGFGLGMRGNPQSRIASEISKEVEKFPEYAERLAAAKRLGLSYITPLEAAGNSGILAQIEGKLQQTPSKDVADILTKRGSERVKTEDQAITNLLNTVSNPKIEAEKNKAYALSYYTKLPPFYDTKKIPSEFKEKYAITVPEDYFGLKDNEIFKAAEEKALSDPEIKEYMKSVPKNSIEYLDKIKQTMGDMMKSPEKGSLSKALIKDAQDQLVNGMSEFSTQYKKANALAERGFARDAIEQWFDKRKQTGASMSQFLKSKETMDELQMHFRNIPEAQQQLKDMKLVFENLDNPMTGKSAKALYSNSMKETRSSAQLLSKLKDNLLYSNDKIVANLITNPEWADEVKKLSKITDKEKLVGALMKTFGKVGAQEASKQK